MIKKINQQVERLLSNRLLVLVVLFAILFSILIGRVFILQIVQGEEHQSDYTYQIEKTIKTSGTRGNIYDVKGRLLAYSKLVYTVSFQNTNDYETLAVQNGTSINEEKNRVIYNVIKILQKNKDKIVSEVPIEITGKGNFRFTETGGRLQKFKRDIFGIGKDESGLSAEARELRKKQLNASAKDVFTYMKNGTMGSPGVGKMFEISDSYSDRAALKIMSVRYTAFLSRYSQYVKVTIANDVDTKSIAEIEEMSADLPGIDVSTKSVRKYKCGEAMSHIIGYTGSPNTDELESYNKGKNEEDKDYYSSDDIVGKTGIEKQMEKYLRGDNGSQTMIVNNIGKVIKNTKTIKAGVGNNIKLSIDSRLQEFVYNQMEKRIAGIVLSKLTGGKSKGDTSDDIKIPMKEVYYALIGNGVIDLENLNGSDATSYEKKVYRKIQRLKDKAIKNTGKMILKSKKTYKQESDANEAYATYVYKLLSEKKILVASSIDSKDKTYLRWKDEKIGLGSFLRHAVNKGWIDTASLNMKNQYSDTEIIMEELVNYIKDQLIDDADFDLQVCEQKIFTGELSGREVCLLLYDQGILNKKKDKDYAALSSGALDSYSFMYQKIKKLEITPAQLGLDPCSGSVVITDTKTGKVKAMVSYPGYDVDRLSNGTDSGYYRQLATSASTPLYNQVLNHRTAPGSTYKPISSLAGLNEGVISTDTIIKCKGLFDKVSPSAKCWIYPGKHGKRNVTTAIEASCNYFFYEVGYLLGEKKGTYSSKLGLDRLNSYATNLGLNKKSGVELSEISPHASDESSVRSAIGQGSNSFAPIQISNYITSVANRGDVFDLSVMDSVVSSSGKTIKKYKEKKIRKLDYKTSYWDAVQEGMRRVVTGKDSSVSKLFKKGTKVKIAGKTGTAQEDKKRPSHALFVSFGPYEKPEITVTTVIPFAYTSANAASLTKKIYNYYFSNDKAKKKLESTKIASEVSSGVAGD